jgi:DNA-binding beta-propeller fold protein YncE
MLTLSRRRLVVLGLAVVTMVSFAVVPAAAAGDPPVASDDGYVVAEDGMLAVSADHVFNAVWAGYGSGDGQFEVPYGVAAGADGEVYVADYGNDRVQVFNRGGAYLRQWGSVGTGNGQFESPHGVAVADGEVYVADSGNSRIQVFSSDGTYLRQWGGQGTGNGEFYALYGLAVAGGEVYVADTDNNRVQVFDTSGTYQRQWGTAGSGDGQFLLPRGIAVSAGGEVYVADAGNDRIEVFDSSGTYLRQWGTPGSGDRQFTKPQGVAIGAGGEVYVADSCIDPLTAPEVGNNRVQVFSPDGIYLTQWGGYGTGDGQFSNPEGVAVDADGEVYVVDSNNHRVEKFTPAGVLGNDSDPDGDALTAVLDTDVSHGVLSLSLDGSFVYVPNAGYVGGDSFTYHANDGTADSDVATVSIDVVGVGYLRVVSDPAVPSQVVIDGVARDTWGLTWVKVRPGEYGVVFADVQGFTTPDPQVVTVGVGATTSVTGSFTTRGWLQVTTSPAVASTISVDGYAMDDWGVWTDVEAGSHEVCFGDVADYVTPVCQTVEVVAGGTTPVEGVFVSSPGASGASGYGLLRVTTNPAVPAQILVDGVPRDSWGLNWVKLAPGDYEVSFADIQGYTTPIPRTVTVVADATTVTVGTYTQRGWLHVTTSPALAGTVYANGVPMNDWGMWTDLEAGSYEVCFGGVSGWIAPACTTAGVTAGATTPITGTYSAAP